MEQKCPVCGHPFSKKWLWLSSVFSEYECPKCKTKYRFSTNRYLAAFLNGILIGVLMITLVKVFPHQTWIYVVFLPAALLIGFVVFWLFPNQIKKI